MGENNLKPIVEETFLHLIKSALERISLFESDTILNYFIRLYVQTPAKADEKLIITDKFYLFKNLWQPMLEILYEEYLPTKEYEFSWEIEITPFTLMQCELTKNFFKPIEFEIQKSLLGVTDEDIEENYSSILEKIQVEKIGSTIKLLNYIPNEMRPKTKKEELILLFRLMNYPPLGELALVLEFYRQTLRKQITDLSKAFSGFDTTKIPNFGLEETLHFSYFHIDHPTFIKYGLDTIENHPSLTEYKTDFAGIREFATKNKDTFKDNYICPCCGRPQEITLSGDILQYKALLENQPLCKKVGIIYLNDFIANYKIGLSNKLYSLISSINKVDAPECLILVEGESEEIAIPFIAFRRDFLLSKRNIQVYNSKSKAQLETDFRNFKVKYPLRKIICLLDSDALKERDNIQRIIKDQKDKYRVVFIKKGTFEDIFDLDLSIEVLNEMYPEGEPIVKSDFDESKGFLKNLKSFLFSKKKAQFDKTLFAKSISFKINPEKLPNEIADILELAKLFTKPAKFIKK